MPNPTIKLNGTDYVILERTEYDRLTTLAKAADSPALPEPDAEGNYPALEYCRATGRLWRGTSFSSASRPG